MKQFIVTIYSPADQEEHEFQTDEARIDSLWALVAMMEIGAWFKVERIKDGTREDTQT